MRGDEGKVRRVIFHAWTIDSLIVCLECVAFTCMQKKDLITTRQET